MADPVPNNLPLQLTSFIGRARELAEIKRILSSTRLLTLTGAGGCGKTRLALQVAAELIDSFPDGVWFVDLAPLSDSKLVLQTVASIFHLLDGGAVSPIERLKNYLGAKNLLLLLDNCEHLMIACAELSNELMRSCPNFQILATSREGLNISGETTWRVPSLSAPDPNHSPPLETLIESEAISFFIERASAAQPNFELTKTNSAAIAQICARLDGMPLALELAAARIKTMGVNQIAARLDHAYRLLTGGSRTAPTRQQTLRAAMDWSYNLLSPSEQILFRRMSVFAGGWTLEAAETICANNDLAPHSILELQSQLVDKSLVILDEQCEPVRYRFLETMRQYADEKLSHSVEKKWIRNKHLEFFVEFAEKAEPELIVLHELAGLDRVENEHANLRAALEWGVENRNPEFALRLCNALSRYWIFRDYVSEGRHWLERTIEMSRDIIVDGNPISRDHQALFSNVLGRAGQLAYFQHEHAVAQAHAEEGLTLARQTGDQVGLALALYILGSLAMDRGDYAAAKEFCEERLVLAREWGFNPNISLSLILLGDLGLLQGDFVTAQARFEEALAISHTHKDHARLVELPIKLGSVAMIQGDYAAARARYLEGIGLARDSRFNYSLAICLVGWAALAKEEQQIERAARLCGAVEALLQLIDSRMHGWEQLQHESTIMIAQAQLDEASFKTIWNEGRSMTPEQAVAYALQSPGSSPGSSPVSPSLYPAGLTEREVEVLRWLVRGLTNQEIADKLVLSKRTVEAHLRSIFGKLDVTTRSAATRVAIEQKLI